MKADYSVNSTMRALGRQNFSATLTPAVKHLIAEALEGMGLNPLDTDTTEAAAHLFMLGYWKGQGGELTTADLNGRTTQEELEAAFNDFDLEAALQRSRADLEQLEAELSVIKL